MPLYPFRCPGCLHQFDMRRPHTERDDPLTCPSCEQRYAQRMMAKPHVAPIPGIYNRLNRHWDESGEPINTRAVDELVNNATKPDD